MKIRSKQHWKNIEAEVKRGNFLAKYFEELQTQSPKYTDLPDEEVLIPPRREEKSG